MSAPSAPAPRAPAGSAAVLSGGVAAVGRGARLRKVVIDRGCVIPEDIVVGEDAASDAARFERTEGGVVLITREMLKRLASE